MAPHATDPEPVARGAARLEPRRLPLFPLLALSIALHLGLAMAIVFFVTRHPSNKPPEENLDLAMDVTIGEAVQELVVTQASTEPPAPIPVPPPPTPPPPEPPPPEPAPEPPPPPVDKPEFVEPPAPVAKPKPPAKQVAKATPSKPAGAPPGAKVGPVAREGVVGGNVTQGKTTGTPGGQKIGAQGWRTPRPPYPAAALSAHIQGSGEVRITTDASGNVRELVITRPIAPILDSNTRQFGLANWKGPPNSTLSKPVIYTLP